MTLLLLLWGCAGEPSGAKPVAPDQVGVPVALARTTPDDVSVPPSVRPEGAPAPTDIPIQGPFKLIRTVDGVANYEAPLPVRPRSLFFSKPLPGMTVKDPDGKTLRFARNDNKKASSWKFTAETVILRVAEGAPKPKAGEFTMAFPKATQREDALNMATSDKLVNDFALRSIQFGPDTRTGVLLPSPATATWTVAFPTNATLHLEGVVLPPETASPETSDGAFVIVEIDGTEVHRQELGVGEWAPVKADLSAYAGAEHALTLRTEGGGSNILDYVFLAEPTLYTPTTEPKRVLMVFLDTLRADHLGMYGYERDTSPKLDAWAEKNAVVFEDARSVAPWTLPTTRSVLTGNIPEKYPISKRLPEYLAEAGWATGAFVGNVYLSSNFDMAQGWSQHGCVNWPRIEDQIPKVEDFIDRHPDRDTLVMLHTMDMHLPYTEPRSYRDDFAGKPPGSLGIKATRTPILKAYKKYPDEVEEWVVGRYDNNIKYTDDQLTPLLEKLDPDIVVIFADHGEEFWEHDDFEHGHTLYDEVLRVPIVLMAPGVEPGRVSEPVSNLDITPTLLDLLGMPQDGLDGWSMVPLTRGEQSTEFNERIRSVGRPLYGQERWGVLVGDMKWTSHDGNEEVYDLSTDPDETQDLVMTADLDPLRSSLGKGLGTHSPLIWRLEVGKLSPTPTQEVTLEIEHPEGFVKAWLGQDPLKSAKASLEQFGNRVVITYKPGKSGSPEIYLVPTAGVDAIEGLTLKQGGEVQVAPQPEVLPAPKGQAERLWTTRIDGRSVRLFYAVAPIPLATWSNLEAMDDELATALEAIGYVHREEDDE